MRTELGEVLDLRDRRFARGAPAGDPGAARPDGDLVVPGWIRDVERQGRPDGESSSAPSRGAAARAASW
ncbi:hypothetical protein [Streptomyces sp. NPDC051921]|uniref:hypothetical protein n=1 Tax=Streptomyces sp. NPDC051921 TaxID=3155806 RepID=UPI0034402E75